MHHAVSFALLALVVFSSAAGAEALNEKSKAPAWGAASQDEKDAWLADYKFAREGVDKAQLTTCLDDYTARPLFATNALAGVASLCETVIEKTE